MRVLCTVTEIDLEGDHGGNIPSTQTECERCGHTTESYGTTDASLRRCLALMREECPNGEANWYTADPDEADAA